MHGYAIFGFFQACAYALRIIFHETLGIGTWAIRPSGDQIAKRREDGNCADVVGCGLVLSSALGSSGVLGDQPIRSAAN